MTARGDSRTASGAIGGGVFWAWARDTQARSKTTRASSPPAPDGARSVDSFARVEVMPKPRRVVGRFPLGSGRAARRSLPAMPATYQFNQTAQVLNEVAALKPKAAPR